MDEKKGCCSKLKGAWRLIASAVGAVVLAAAGIFAIKKGRKKKEVEEDSVQD